MLAKLSNTSHFTNRMAIAYGTLNKVHQEKISYFIETAVLEYDRVRVQYIDEASLNNGMVSDEHWCAGFICTKKLLDFVTDKFRDESMSYGSDMNAYIYLDSNLHTAVKSYLDAGKGLI